MKGIGYDRVGHRQCWGPVLPVLDKPYEFIGFGSIDVTEPHQFIWLGDHGPTPYECVWLGAVDVTKPFGFIWFGDLAQKGVGLRSPPFQADFQNGHAPLATIDGEDFRPIALASLTHGPDGYGVLCVSLLN